MKKIGVLVSNIRIDPQKRVVESMIRYAVKNNIILDIFSCNSSPENTTLHNKAENSIHKLPHFEDYEGVVLFANTLFPASYSNALIEMLKTRKIPVILIATKAEGVSSIGIDNYKAMKTMVSHFIKEHGFRKINYVSTNMFSKEARERHAGYIEALGENDLNIDQDRIYIGDSIWDTPEHAIERFLKNSEGFPEAIVCGDDLLALGICDMLTKYNVRIPEDIAVSGFNGIYDAKNFTPKITTVEYPYEEIGELACFHLIYNEKEHFENKDVIVEPIPIYTQSCGCKENKGVSFEEFKKAHFTEKSKNIRINDDATRMSSEFSSISKLEDFKSVFEKYIKFLECDELYLCLYEGWDNNDSNTDISKNKCLNNKAVIITEERRSEVVIAYVKNKILESKNQREKAFKDMYKNTQKGKTNIYFPINFQGKMFGYLILCDYIFAIESALFPGWLMNVGIALEAICRQRTMDLMVEKLNETYLVDQLTGLYNRMGFNKYAEEILAECKKKSKNFCIMFLDLDSLKAVNDQYGHDEGDRFIRMTADILKEVLGNQAVIMRYGGDEFVAAIGNISIAKIKNAINEIKNRMDSKSEKIDLQYKLSASVGYFNTVPEPDSSLGNYIAIADKSMYEEKRQGSTFILTDFPSKITE